MLLSYTLIVKTKSSLVQCNLCQSLIRPSLFFPVTFRLCFSSIPIPILRFLSILSLIICNGELFICMTLSLSQQHDTSNQQPGMILSTHVSSSKGGGGTKSLEGLNLSLSERYVDSIRFISL